MFIGKYYHRLETQNRISLPKKFREINETWIVTRGLDGCLFLFQPADFKSQLTEIANRSLTKKTNRDLVRIMTHEAVELTSDPAGRIHLPEYLTKLAHLTDDVVVVGSLHHLELWDLTIYHAYVDQLENQAEAIAEAVEL
ncbi:MAG TPA: division/cell wall cluster transcriptional repressor MraZ [Candidatus Pacebacteria bacterium]|nr:division/cell wall cluster transcriptional repressor MraZ [Candidatus Paceibacterota bacterium]